MKTKSRCVWWLNRTSTAVTIKGPPIATTHVNQRSAVRADISEPSLTRVAKRLFSDIFVDSALMPPELRSSRGGETGDQDRGCLGGHQPGIGQPGFEAV